jgi:hypothetical protein
MDKISCGRHKSETERPQYQNDQQDSPKHLFLSLSVDYLPFADLPFGAVVFFALFLVALPPVPPVFLVVPPLEDRVRVCALDGFVFFCPVVDALELRAFFEPVAPSTAP